MKKEFVLFFMLLFVLVISSAQSKFNIVGNKESITIRFKLINNLILLPAQLNGADLTFILDTGVSKSLLFNVESKDSVLLKKTKKIKVKGLGEDKYFEALKSNNNLFRIDNVISPNFEIFLILNEKFDFSARMGVNVNGLIGTDLLKDFIVEINYIKKKIKITKPKYYKYKRCKKCSEFELLFQKRKPYVDTFISIENDNFLEVKLLVDSGSGEALWLFENSNDKIKIPKKNFDDFLGKGLSGNIFGKRAKLNAFKMSNFSLNNMLVSYPDSTSIFLLNKRIYRNGTLGSEILKRFHIILDYPNKKMTLKKNSNFKKPFFYDKSGLEIIHNGKILVKEANVISTHNSGEKDGTIISYAYSYNFKNSYIISLVKLNSPAAIVGLKEGDIILKINDKHIFEFTLQNLIKMFSSEEGKRIKLKIDRNGFQYTFRFKLKDML